MKYEYYLYLFNCMSILTTLPAQSFGINMFINIWIEEFETTRVYLSFVWLIASMVSGICVIFNGHLIDKFGVKICIRIIYPCYILCVWLVHQTVNITQLSVLICLMRILGPESIGTISYISICQWFEKNRGKAFSFLSILDCIFMGAPSVIIMLISNYGWRETYIFFAIYVSVMLLPAILFIKNKINETIENESSEIIPFNFKLYAHLVLNNFIFCIFWSGANIHAIDYFHRLNAKEIGMFIYLSSTFGIIAGSLISGRILDKCNNKQKIKILAISHLCLSGIIIWSTQLGYYDSIVYGFSYGMMCGCNFTCYSVVYPSLFGTNDLGKIQAMNNGIGMFATGSGPLIFSFCKLWFGSYYWCSIIISIFLLLSSSILMIKNI